MNRELPLQVEDQIQAGYWQKEWCIFWPSQFAEAFGVSEDDAISALKALELGGKLRGRVEFYDDHGETLYECDFEEAKHPHLLPVARRIEAFRVFFELTPEWRRRLDEEKKKRQARTKAGQTTN